ncbi:N-acetylmuramoyl-L-alanine amidase [uncultured Algimonas sp.]|uniref:N-acetylmuramoyl-L-alanine amidase family protein n=1 Tax=uncultured Algimonas sp. TaxID=1547920 RepID=UPI0026043399|nr:N-acetylmuramoyl-L-alanine amidase [uncultured Algimonas sp.]
MSIRPFIAIIMLAVMGLFAAVPATAQSRYFKDAVPYPRLKPAPIKPSTLPLIVLDPGHGGRDPGAIGQNGLQEKTVTTSAANELKRLLEATGRYRVVLTRNNDSYVEHDNRIRIARERQADLFISIHADSTSGRNVRGASVYTLADRARNRSRRIVNSQNWIMDVDLAEQTDPVGDFLVDLAMRSTESQSEAFADILLSNLEGQTRLVGNSHRRAGYFVLLAPDVPAVLLELGFLSNAQDEKLLKTKAHRDKLMRAVRLSIDEYFSVSRRSG